MRVYLLHFANSNRRWQYISWLAVICLVLVSIIWHYWEIAIITKTQKIVFDLKCKKANNIDPVDSLGIPVQRQCNGTNIYIPLVIARQAQAYFKQVSDFDNKAKFYLYTDWLKNNVSEKGKYALNYNNYDLPTYNMKAPWASALTQATVLNAYYERYLIDRDTLWLNLSKRTLKSLRPETALLSVRIYPNGIWFEEYPSNQIPFALSGMISTLIELYKYATISHDPLGYELFEGGYSALIIRLPAFDFYGYSYCDLLGKTSNRADHQLHIHLLKEINKIKQNRQLVAYYQRWEFYDNLPLPVQLILNPHWKRILGFILNWVVFVCIFYIISRLRIQANNTK